MSPLLADTSGSNGLVLATAARFTFALFPRPAGPNGPVPSGRPKKNPGASSGAARLAVEVLPDETPSTSGSPKSQETSMVIGTVPRAATVGAAVVVGGSQFGWASSDSGSAPLCTPDTSSSSGTRRSRRASAKISFLMLPVFVMVMVAVTGFPGASTVPAEFGMPLVLTDGAANETDPVNGSLSRAPSPGPASSSTRGHRPGAGVRWKNCMVGPNPRKLSL